MSMRSKLQGPLRIVFRPAARGADGEELQPNTPPVPLVWLTAYSGDSLAYGHLRLTADRLTDLMNDHDEFEFVDTYVQSLEDDHGLALRDVTVAREEIFAVAVSGPRGNPTRRTRTRPMPVELRVGRYDITGNLHVVPGTDPMGSFRRRRIMVPLTEATITYDGTGGRRSSRFDTILVNRLLADWIAPATRADVRPPSFAVDADSGGLARDYTPELHLT